MRATQSDFIMRMIEQLGAAVRRLRELLGRGAPAAADVLDEAERAEAQLFGALHPVLQKVTAETAITLIPEARQVELWVELVRLQADAARLLEDIERADRLEERAQRLLDALGSRGSIPR